MICRTSKLMSHLVFISLNGLSLSECNACCGIGLFVDNFHAHEVPLAINLLNLFGIEGLQKSVFGIEGFDLDDGIVAVEPCENFAVAMGRGIGALKHRAFLAAHTFCFDDGLCGPMKEF